MDDSKTMQKRLKDIPLYITDKPIVQKGREPNVGFQIPKSYQIGTSIAKKKAPRAQKEMYETIKKYHSVIEEIKRQKPKVIIYTSVPHKSMHQIPARIYQDNHIFVKSPRSFYPKAPPPEKRKKIYKKFKLSKDEQKRLEYTVSSLPHHGEPKGIREKKKTQRRAEIILHELTHIKQQRKLGKKKYQQLFKKEQEQYSFKDVHTSPMEAEATDYARKKIKEEEQKNFKRY